MAFDHSAQERCPLQQDAARLFWICPHEKIVAWDGGDVPCCGELEEENQAMSSTEAFFQESYWKWAPV